MDELRRAFLSVAMVMLMAPAIWAQEPIEIGSRLELLVDDALIGAMSGGLRLQLHRPTPREIVFETDAPWEGNACGYQSVFQDGDVYRLYYHGLHYRMSGPPAQALEEHPWVLCYAESDDGIHWRRPELGLLEFAGSKDNNIILTPDAVAQVGGDPAHTAAFLDANPDCPADERYKIIIVGSKPRGLYVLKSADGIRFSLMNTEPFMTEGAFDSQNLAFWDSVRGEYREYHRGFKDGIRDIMTSTSKDLLRFSQPQWLQYPGAPREHLYTNTIHPYYRAPHIFIGFPARYTDRGWLDSVLDLPGLDERLARARSHTRFATAITDAVFMASRDGLAFKRWPEAFIRPGPRQRESWVYGDNYPFWGLIQTRSPLADSPDELSIYATEGYWEGTSTSIRRYALRIDGFVSATAPLSGGELVTRPLVFTGGNLTINAATSGAGSLRVEVRDAQGNPVDGYRLDDCPQIICDSLRHTVRWDGRGGDLRPLAGKPIRLRFELHDADLYAFQFVPYEPEPRRPDLTAFGALPPRNEAREAFTVIDEDFGAFEAGTTPAQGDLDPGGKASVLLVREGSVARVQVLNDDPPGSGKAGSSHHIRMERLQEPHDKGGFVWLQLAPQDAADSLWGVVELSARVWVPSVNQSAVDIYAFDSPVGQFTHRGFNVSLQADGAVSYYRESIHPAPGLAIKTDAWQDVSIRADLRERCFDLTVGDATARGLPFGQDTGKRLRTIGIGPDSNNSVLYLDRLSVRVIPRGRLHEGHKQ